jgi:rod shape-determining protein MreC
MKSLLRFLLRYHVLILFVILEVIAFTMITRNNSFHRAKILNVKHAIVGRYSQKYNNFSSYLSLVKENKELLAENHKLYNQLPDQYFNPLNTSLKDTTRYKQYNLIPARVTNNSTNKQFNFITLNRGRFAGIEPEMAVINDEGIVGVVKEVTDNYSSVISVLNREFNPNGKIKKNGYYGPVEWPGIRYDEAYLKEIPLHANVEVGDTIVTSEFTSIFPEGIMIGTVKEFEPEAGLFLRITVKLSTDFKKLSNVWVIKDKRREEKLELELESESSHD